ncbi:phage integrase N-terminal SAM-like domain-containing protein [Methylobacterium sp. GC_Met_2]|uniref:tyrosine-type recombinase/integrase n=1 Tax=Methylobacterium sp. GC_Met_2 TaxID=2937376 RepID=UPI00226B66F6|nr:phage integrase N-terminal SAM-like domain-containing protein [Methylobacterium sp. GC_Met_2]
MHDLLPAPAISPLHQRLIEEMSLRRFSHETQHNDLRDVGRLATFLGRRLETATAEDLRRFQVEQREASVPVPTLNSIVLALRFIFIHAIDRPDLARRLVRLAYPRTLPVALSRDEVVRLLAATTRPEHRAALAVAYGAGLRVAEVAALKVTDMVACCHVLTRCEFCVVATASGVLTRKKRSCSERASWPSVRPLSASRSCAVRSHVAPVDARSAA